MRGYRITPSAEGDLREILEYVAERDGVDRAIRLHARLVKTFERIADSPRAGRLREEVMGPTIRTWTVFRFLVIYEAERAPVEILRVLHGMREL
jgi:plasmid stabilization system protein ParE